MAKRPDTLETTLLTIQLLNRIPRNRRVTANELHRQIKDAGIDRDLRTIQRQLDMLCEHFPIDRDERNKPFGYRWLDKAQGLTIPSLTPQESLLLLLAEEHLKNLLPTRLMGSMQPFFSQARSKLNSGSNARLEREWPGKIRVVATNQPLLPPKIAQGVFEAVSEALYKNCWLELDYRNSAGKRSTVRVMPFGLVQQGPRLYLVCRYQGYDNERNLALHRILSATISTLTFDRPKNFSLEKYDSDGRFGFGEGKKIRLSFRVRREAGLHLLETPLSTDQQATEIDADTLEITATVIDSAMLDWWLRGFGDAISTVSKHPVEN
ncbi:MAG: WYL domain-containing protein [Sterolibacterium sp.]|nr:WYL domain-containing protein [Sterolibacterium sp.]MBP9800583.1 WYL domain-containing protein [Sterolibacterium sp.]